MNTKDYPYFRFPFVEFNKAQEAVIPHITGNNNIVVSFATSAGKTVLAEAAFGYHLQTNKFIKCVYTCPFKALGYQKYEEWSKNEQFSKYGVMINQGDMSAEKTDFEINRLLILTNECFDSKTRNEQNYEWIKSIGCLVIDEAHMLGQKGRGDKIEAFLMRFTAINKEARIIMLSATMSNIGDIAEWIKKLNGKETIKVFSNWKPNKVTTRFITFSDEKEKIKSIIESVKEAGFNEKIIIFVHSKFVGADIIKALKKKNIRCAFHNASLPYKKRASLEEEFNSTYSSLNVLVSTSTLSSGVNMGM